ncbi:MAG: cell division protein SepF [Bacillota bacterium]|nr:cell division protein SepF [Bacillota bacterium]
MGSGWLEKIMSFIGFADNYEDEEDDDPVPVVEERSRKRAPVLSLHASPEAKIMVVSPVTFDEAEKIASHLKGRKSVIVNFEHTPKDTAQRIIDFLSGAVFVLNGGTLKITAETFLFVPSNFSIHPEGLTNEWKDNPFLEMGPGGVKDRFQEKG